ncbi:twin-arginine translocase TatA/TatE family subunit [Mesonia sediminis]|jgi:sec-independent protein translocase protein TatA|uniref:Sec-independent protein translocase protein TatA n=1 Tax=Mesonia sediminis TaxID=1703946 RepID=A0ABW5SG73_9FLAO|nr:twin-arginine translocase TatA/TatE family subunit [Mesonia sp. HuA40]TXK73630.1 twin-arginine translocase TatA/TatE family subunit [Mesonia sp. HuA40]
MYISFLFISGAEIAFIVFILVMVFGADKIPEIARGLGQGMRQIKDATNDIKNEITQTSNEHLEDFRGKEITDEVDKVKEEIEEITGAIRRRR